MTTNEDKCVNVLGSFIATLLFLVDPNDLRSAISRLAVVAADDDKWDVLLRVYGLADGVVEGLVQSARDCPKDN